MTRRRAARICAGTVALAWLAIVGLVVQGQDAGVAAEGPLRFRRVYVPADNVAQWPRRDVRYLPMDPAEFERLVQEAEIDASPSGAQAQLASAAYAARLEDGVLAGTAEFEFDHRGQRPAWVKLDPCRLAISDAQWAQAKTPCLLGTRNGAETGIVVARADTASLRWTLSGRRDATGVLQFGLEFPNCVRNRLELDLPAHLLPLLSGGVVMGDQASDERWRRWHFELGGQSSLILRLIPADSASARRRLPLARMLTTYRLSTRGMDVGCDIRCDVQHDPLSRVELMLDGGLQLTNARLEGNDIPWSSAAGDAPGATRVELQLPQAITGAGRLIHIEGVAPLAPNEAAKLPRIVPQNLAWQEGTLTAIVASPLEIRQFIPEACRQTKAAPLTAPASGELIELQSFSPDATALIATGRPRYQFQASAGTTVTLGEGIKTARTDVQCTVTGGERFVVSVNVSNEWVVDAIESIPATMISDWTLTPDGDFHRLSLDLAEPLTAGRPLRFMVHARGRSSPLGALFGPEDLRVVELPAGQNVNQWIAVRGEEPYRVVVVEEDASARLDPAKLSETERTLLTTLPGDILLAAGPRRGWRVELKYRPPVFEADLRVEAVVAADRVTENYRIRCLPQSASVERVLVHFTLSREAAPRWRLPSDLSAAFRARRLPAGDPDAAVWQDQGETWEIRFDRPQSEAFDVAATRSTPWIESSLPVSLAMLGESTTQNGVIVIRAAADLPLRMECPSLQPKLMESSSRAMDAPIRAVYRYDPTRDAVADAPSPINLVRPTVAPPQAAAVAWQGKLESRYEPSGETYHWATFHLENVSREACRIQLPEGARLRGLWVDGRLLTPELTAGGIEAPLPPRRRFTSLLIHYAMRGEPLGLATEWSPQAPEIDVPVMARQWTVWTPPGHAAWLPAAGAAAETPPLGIAGRLFGPLGRAAGYPPFNPFQRESWFEAADAAEPSAAALRAAQQFLDRLALFAAQGPATWSDALAVDASLPSGGPAFWIDATALADEQIWPNSPIEAPAHGARETSGAEVLAAHRLILIVHPRAIVLTSAPRIAAHQGELRALDPPVLQQVLDGPFGSQLAGLGSRPSAWIAATAWREMLAAPWVDASDAAEPVLASSGWTARCWSDGSGVRGPAVRIVDLRVLSIETWAAFLLIAVLGAWRWKRKPGRLMLVAGVSMALALLLPPLAVPAVSGLVLGALFCLIAQYLYSWRAIRATPRAAPASTVTRWTRSGVALPIVGFIILAAWAVRADESAPATEAYWVLIPADEAGQPKPEQRYQVPAAMEARLRALASRGGGGPTGWMLTRANYQVSVDRDAQQSQLAASDVIAHFDLHVFEPRTLIELPLSEAVHPVESGVLDGRVIPLTWNAERGAVSFEVEEAGTSRLEVAVRASVHAADGLGGMNLAIPSCPLSTVEISHPLDAPLIELPDAVGRSSASPDRPLISAALGPVRRLALRWPAGAVARDAAPTYDADELLWMRVRPASVVLDVRRKLHIASGQIRELRMNVDPRLRHLPTTNTDVMNVEFRIVANEGGGSEDVRAAQIRFAEPLTGEATVPLSYLVTGTSGVGNLRLPRLDWDGPAPRRRWLAVTLDPALDVAGGPPDDIPVVPAGDFTALWGAATPGPTIVYDLSNESGGWTLATRPREARTTADQRLTLSAHRGGLAARYEARLMTTDGQVFQHRVKAPAALNIETVSLTEEGVERVARWVKDDSGAVTVLLSAPVSGEQQLTLIGSLPVEMARDVSLPMVELVDAADVKTTVAVFREASVLAAATDLRDLTPARPAAAFAPASADEYLVAAWTVEGAQPSARLRIQPNRPNVRLTQVARLERDGQQWILEVEVVGQISGGVLDSLRWDVPSRWGGPWTVVPPADAQSFDVPGQDRKRLVIQPREPWDKEFHLVVRGPLSASPRDSVLPLGIVPQSVREVERYVQLPTQTGVEQVQWTVSQLRQAPLPEGWPTTVLGKALETYRVTGADPGARLTSIERSGAFPRARLVEYRVLQSTDGGYVGLASFDVDPAELRSVVVELPPGVELQRVTVADRLISATPAGDRRWELAMLLPRLPQRVELLFRGQQSQTSAAPNRCSIACPALVDVRVENTLWTIAPATDYEPVANDARWLSPVRYEQVRLEKIAVTLDSTPEDLSAFDHDDLTAWFNIWRQRWQAGRSVVWMHLRNESSPAASQPVEEDLLRLERELTRTTARLPTDVIGRLADVTEGSMPAGELWSQASAGRRVIHLGFSGEMNHVELAHRDSAVIAWFERALFAFGVIMLGILIAVAFRRGRLPLGDLASRWPHVGGVLLGLAWWMWLTPSWLGLAMLLTSAALALRPSLRPIREHASSIVSTVSGAR